MCGELAEATALLAERIVVVARAETVLSEGVLAERTVRVREVQGGRTLLGSVRLLNGRKAVGTIAEVAARRAHVRTGVVMVAIRVLLAVVGLGGVVEAVAVALVRDAKELGDNLVVAVAIVRGVVGLWRARESG